MPQRFTSITRTITAALILCAGALVASPAQAANYRDLKSVRYGYCLYAYGDPIEDIFLEKCNTKPAQFGNWAVTRVGYYNNHPLWVLKRQKGRCLGIGGSSDVVYLYSSCDAKGSKNVWEVFTTKTGRYVLKSFGAFQSWNKHVCLTFDGRQGGGKPQLGACSLTSTVDQIYK